MIKSSLECVARYRSRALQWVRLHKLAGPRWRRWLAEVRFRRHGAAAGSILCSGSVQLGLDASARVVAGTIPGTDPVIFGIAKLGYASPSDWPTCLAMAENSKLIFGPGVEIGRGTSIHVGRDAVLEIGEGTYLSDGANVSAESGVTHIGRGCAIASGVRIMADSGYQIIPGSPPKSGVTVHDKVWIGVDAVILAGAEVGPGSVVAARSVVTGRFGPAVLLGGVPARVLREDILWSKAYRDKGMC